METVETELGAESWPNEATLPTNSEQNNCEEVIANEANLPNSSDELRALVTDADSNEIKTQDENTGSEEDAFYSIAAQYWSQVPPTVDGMLGGFGFVSHTDIQGSDSFISQIFKV